MKVVHYYLQTTGAGTHAVYAVAVLDCRRYRRALGNSWFGRIVSPPIANMEIPEGMPELERRARLSAFAAEHAKAAGLPSGPEHFPYAT